MPQIVYLGRVWEAAPASIAIAALVCAMAAGAAVFPETKGGDQKPVYKPLSADSAADLLLEEEEEDEL